MSDKEKELKLIEALKLQDVFKLKSIINVNHDPHSYMIGARHIKHASDNYGGMLGEETMEKIPCAMPKCGLFYKDHTSDKVAFLLLIRDATNKEMNEALRTIVKELGEKFIDGFGFVESKFKVIE